MAKIRYCPVQKETRLKRSARHGPPDESWHLVVRRAKHVVPWSAALEFIGPSGNEPEAPSFERVS
jgi:hypothetical protein